ncbi:hypothetical protein CASFOL_005455 [Castilleja foliolosa]|uniref:Peptidase A1 domain-containing protein n=1 Tax=Castilleja foliolosa TaxID=1961234 RepID=A0ABD3E4Q2_9LAMI
MGPLKFSIYLIKFVVYCSSLLLLLSSYFPEKAEATKSHFHSVKVTSLLPASTCSRRASTGSNQMKYSTTLEVVHMLGPCSPNHEHTKNKPSLSDILSQDQSRVDSIQARSNQTFLRNNKASLPAQLGLPLNTFAYVATIGLGTPQQNVTLMIDSSSDVTWTQCRPCINCYEQRDPVYNPFSSSTFSRISCDSECFNFSHVLPCFRGPCAYIRKYGDGSYSHGVVSKERLTITSTTHDVFQDFVFGCGQHNEGLFGKTAGMLGLGRTTNEMSLLHQTAQKYRHYFSYCFPSTVSSTGHLTFGRKKSKYSAKNVKFIPLLPDPHLYRIEIVEITVGHTKLPIHPSVFQNPGTIIDSGAAVTHLPLEAYVKLRDAFKYMMRSSYRSAPAYQNLDTCYYINNHTNVEYPFVSFTFSRGVEVQLHPSGIVSVVNSTMVCLAFAGRTDPNKYNIFGNIQQRTLEIVYDVASERLGFGQGGCE